MSSGKRKSTKKAYFNSSNPAKKSKANFELSVGMKGFLCTYNGNEKGCKKEALNILDDYYSYLYPTDNPAKETDEEEDIEASLKKEINNEKKIERKFKPVTTGMYNCLFISSAIDNVVELNEAIVRDINDTKVARSRFLIRLIPVEVTCKAFTDDVMKSVDGLLDKHFKGDPTTYCIIVNRRNNDKFDKSLITAELSRLIRFKNCNHKVDLKSPAKAVLVEVLRNKCCISVVKDYYALKKYNLIQLATTQKEVNAKPKEARLDSDQNDSTSGEAGEKTTNGHNDPKSTATNEDGQECKMKNETEKNVNVEDDTHEELDACVGTIDNSKKSCEQEKSEDNHHLSEPKKSAED